MQAEEGAKNALDVTLCETLLPVLPRLLSRVRAMFDDKGRAVKAAGPSMAVSVLGLEDVPNAGDSIVTTQRGNRLFLHVLSPNVEEVELPVPFRVRSVRTLADDSTPRHTAHNGLLRIYGLEIDRSCPDYVIEIK